MRKPTKLKEKTFLGLMKNHITYCFIFTFFIFGKFVSAQNVIYQDVLNGGITGGGFSTNSGNGTVISHVNIPNGSTIKKALLLSSCDGLAPDVTVILNGANYTFKQEHIVTSKFISAIHPLWTWSNSTIRAIDITNDINPLINTYSLTIPPQFNITVNGFYSSFYIVIIFENASLPLSAVTLFLNEKNVNPYLSYQFTNLLPVQTNNDAGLCLWSTFMGDTITDGSFVKLNNNPIGLIGGTESNSSNTYSGVYGNFSYSSNSLIGLEDDTPDAFFKATDGLANIVNYIPNNSTAFNLDFQYQTPSSFEGAYSNPVCGFIMGYSTPCQPFNVSVSNDTLVCPGEAVQLHASGGVQYEWLPHKNLSCYNCANPVFTGDSSQFYSVRIWNNDSCSVVRPVMVRVRPKPTFSNLSSSPSVCGESTGSIVGISPNASNYSLDNTAWQASGSFSNLQAGNYTVYVTDTNGCVGDSTLSVTEQTTVHAQFTATPSTGTVPLSVVLNNQSSNYTHLEWFVDGVSQGANFSQFLAGQSGVYDIELVAWQNNSTCADTFSLQISAYDSLLISIPNIVTPNQDGINNYFSIQSNQPLNITYSILNRWGNELTTGVLNKQQGNVVLWNIPNEITDGVYFYKITFSSENPQIQQQLEQLGATKTGFVEVVR